MIYEQEYLLHLLSSSVNNIRPDNPEKDINWQTLRKIAEEQKILPLIYDTVAKLEKTGPDAETMKKWQDETLFCAYFFTMQNEQFYSVFRAAEEKGVDMLLLKGVVLKDLYPVPELRTMSDCDIIIKKEQLEEVKEVFASEGYTIAKELENAVEFEKKGSLKFELSYSLFSFVKSKKEFNINIWENIAPVIGNHIVKLSDENSFIYSIVHLAKHIMHKGAGIRNLVDIVLLAKQKDLDWSYIIKQMKLLNIEKFFYGIMKVSEENFGLPRYFEHPDVDDDILNKLIGFMMSNGIYGATDNIFIYDVRNSEGSKLRRRLNYIERIFPPREKLTERYSYAKKYPVLISVAWIHRLFKVIFVDKFSVKKGLNSIKTASLTATKQIEILDYFNINYYIDEE